MLTRALMIVLDGRFDEDWPHDLPTGIESVD